MISSVYWFRSNVYKIMMFQFKNTKLKVIKYLERFNSIWMIIISSVFLFLIVKVKLKTTVQYDKQTNGTKLL